MPRRPTRAGGSGPTARARGWPVICSRYLSADPADRPRADPCSPDAAFLAGLGPEPGDPVVTKYGRDIFDVPELPDRARPAGRRPSPAHRPHDRPRGRAGGPQRRRPRLGGHRRRRRLRGHQPRGPRPGARRAPRGPASRSSSPPTWSPGEHRPARSPRWPSAPASPRTPCAGTSPKASSRACTATPAATGPTTRPSVRVIELVVRLRRTGMPVRDTKDFVAMTRQGAATHGRRMALLQAHRERAARAPRRTGGRLARHRHQDRPLRRTDRRGPRLRRPAK